ncbi:MAG: hypothetical protein KDK66_07270 [Deltaproteobacteria bacterium]|nr:hypothetical protein [Deltaproteobacteria bacterium]
MKLEKKQFVKYLDQFKKELDLNHQECKRLKNILDLEWFYEQTCRHHDLIVSLLRRLFGVNGDWLIWFCFENNFGRKGLSCDYWEGLASKVPIRSAGDFWDCLKEMEREKI